jgi:undecaprenyl-diphosphatase
VRTHRSASGATAPAATVIGLDWSLFHAINGGVATHDWIEDPVTLLAAPAVAFFAIATAGLWLLARPYGDTKWKLASLSALVSAAAAMLANQVITHAIWERPRPYTTHPASDHLLASASADPSFPSDHAAAAFAIAFAVLAFSRRGGIAFLGAATLVGLSRIGLGMHYPGDVLAGAVVGWLAAAVVTQFARGVVSRLVTLLSTVTDPLLRPLWDRLPRRSPLGQ